MTYDPLSEEGEIIQLLTLEKNALMMRNRELAHELIKAEAARNGLARQVLQLGREVERLRALLGVKQ